LGDTNAGLRASKCEGKIYESLCFNHELISDHLPSTSAPVPSSSHSISPSYGAEIEEEEVDIDDNLDMNDFMDWLTEAFDDPDVSA
jgi:hypothetical protein